MVNGAEAAMRSEVLQVVGEGRRVEGEAGETGEAGEGVWGMEGKFGVLRVNQSSSQGGGSVQLVN